MIWSVVQLEDFISCWKDRWHVKVQTFRSDVQKVHSFPGLFFPGLSHNQGSQKHPWERPPKQNTVTNGLCLTSGTLVEQLFAWETAYPYMPIDVMNDESWFIKPNNSLPPIFSPVTMFPGRCIVGKVVGSTWSTEADVWDVCWAVPYLTVSP